MEHVNHPKHYQGKNGIETIEIIRHYVCDIANALKYLMRAGKKQEMGMEDAEKESEDLKKALWYIFDYKKHLNPTMQKLTQTTTIEVRIKQTTGYHIQEITEGLDNSIATSLQCLLRNGLIWNGKELCHKLWFDDIDNATKVIQQRILDIEHQLLNKELESTVQVMNGQAVDGEDYVPKPGCVCETEPEHYDPLNMIVVWGKAYSLTDEALYNPCAKCNLMEVCYDDWRHPDASVCHELCRLHQAKTNEYYREVGIVKYSPRFGTVEVVEESNPIKKL